MAHFLPFIPFFIYFKRFILSHVLYFHAFYAFMRFMLLYVLNVIITPQKRIAQLSTICLRLELTAVDLPLFSTVSDLDTVENDHKKSFAHWFSIRVFLKYLPLA